MKSLECDFNPVKRTYNPHLHLLVATKQMAELIIGEWLKLCTLEFATQYAQNMQPVNDKEKILIEIIKYGSKIFTEQDVTAKANKKTGRDIYAAALYNIFTAMKGCQIFDRFGFNVGKPVRETKATLLNQYEQWVFDLKLFDWVQSDNENKLSGYTPPLELINLLAYNIDTDCE